MSISTELSSEIVLALFGGGKKSPQELKSLGELAFIVQDTLLQLERDVSPEQGCVYILQEERHQEIIGNRKMDH